MITFSQWTVSYAGAKRPVLDGIDFTIPEGEMCLLVGTTGVGKTTLLKSVNGLVPHFSGGTVAGTVTVDGKETKNHRPADLADVVGYVGQDPLAGFVCDFVEDELAYAMESLAVPDSIMRKRVAETVDLLGLDQLRHRPLATLSAGQRQRVAIGAAMTTQPKVLVLDEPTSALDPGAAEDVLAALHRLVHDLGVTVLLAEHRLERVAQYTDSVALLRSDRKGITVGSPGEVLAESELSPPVVKLAKRCDFEAVPVSVRSARRLAVDLRSRLDAVGPPTERQPSHGEPLLSAKAVTVRYGPVVAVDKLDLAVSRHERVAIMGRNGSGKSSLLWSLQGSGRRSSGTITVDGVDPAERGPKERRSYTALVPSEPTDLLYAETVADECAQADLDSGAEAGACRQILHELIGELDASTHPRDLSEGQRLALALSVSMTSVPPLLMLDEPTRGLDYRAKAALCEKLVSLSAEHAIVVTTHDVEFVAEYATRVVVLSDGEIVADGPTRDIVTSSAMFAPQVAKVTNPHRYLTVSEVVSALSVGETL